MKWKFLAISVIALLQGELLVWNEWMLWKEFENTHTSPDSTVIICHISYVTTWPPIIAIILSLLVFTYCLGQFFRLNAPVPIQRRRLKILTRRQ